MYLYWCAVYAGLSRMCLPVCAAGTAHCANMYPARNQDPPQLTLARDHVLMLLQRWLSEGQLHWPIRDLGKQFWSPLRSVNDFGVELINLHKHWWLDFSPEKGTLTTLKWVCCKKSFLSIRKNKDFSLQKYNAIPVSFSYVLLQHRQ